MTEEWRPIPSVPGYEASSLGRIRNSKRKKPRTSPVWGLYRVASIRGKTHKVYRLVAEAFHGPRPDGLVVRHLDGDHTNDKPDNLAYGTFSDNNHDTVQHGRNRNAIKTHCKRGHAFDATNTVVRPNGQRRCIMCGRQAALERYYRRKAGGDQQQRPAA